MGDRGARTVLVLLALILGGGACRTGGGGGRTSASPPATGSGGAYCSVAREALGRLGSLVEPGQMADPSAAAAIYRELAAFLDAAATTGPGEIQADAAAAASVMDEYSEALQQAGSQAAAVPLETTAKLQSEQFVAGITRIADYTRTTCGLAG